VPDVADVAVERLDVVAVGIEQVCGVVAGPVLVSVAGLAVRPEAALDAGTVEAVDLIP
jgi:hypothetical protein